MKKNMRKTVIRQIILKDSYKFEDKRIDENN